jgi:ATP/maltotriose-dependent transcriptional regulator MalT
MAEKIEEISAGRRHIIERPRLTKLLDETSARIIMLVAPAGYGKTTLARQWLASRSHAWYQASAASADLAALGEGLATVTDTLVHGAGHRLREWLPARQGSKDDVAVATGLLSADLERWPRDSWLVIDDYHCLDTAAAEEMIDGVTSQAHIRLLLTSRRRPRWATSRRLLYGEIFEVDQESLAMNQLEAEEVLGARTGEGSRALVARAHGWPAVIGLAAVAEIPTVPDDESLPLALHDYIADELYGAMPLAAQRALCEVALVPVITDEILGRLLGQRRAKILQRALPSGILTRTAQGELLLHPLLRAFVLRKLAELGDPYAFTTATRATRLLISLSAWQEAFALVRRYKRLDLLEELLASALYDLLNQGRLATLGALIEYGREYGLESPSLDLADAESAFRHGFHERAKSLARQAGFALPKGSALASKAFCRAGQSAYFTDEPADAIRDLLRAKELAQTPNDLRSAVWGHFIATVELGDPDAAKVLREFEAIGAPSLDDLLRVQNGRLLIASRYGGIDQALTDARSKLGLVGEVGDPIVRASFLHIYSSALRLAGFYDDAREAVRTALQTVETFHLGFARPHLSLTKAATALGMRRFREATLLLDQVEGLARERSDVFLLMSALAWHSRVLLLEGAPEAAVRITAQSWPRLPGGGQYAEFLACRALAFARLGATAKALELLDLAEQTSSEVEARSLCLWGRALVALWTQPRSDPAISQPATTLVRKAFVHSSETGVVDSFVFAHHSEPAVLRLLDQEPALHDSLAIAIARTQSYEGGRLKALWPGASGADDVPTALKNLTRREREVYELLAEGRSNKEIARSLFIVESTVKVHVRHILKKLSVRTRTEAAVLGTKTPSPP